jgi:hypothetical protein
MEKKRIDDVKEAVKDERTVPPEVYLPPTIAGKKTRTAVVQSPISVSDHIVRIQTDGDPVGQLIAIMNGSMIPSYVVQDDGTVKTVYETATVAQRISIAKWLGDRVMPKVNVSMKGEMSNDWEANLKNAAVRDTENGA